MNTKRPKSNWTFLTNHAVVLGLIARDDKITARVLALDTGITERAVRKIIAELAAEGYILKTKEGRGVRYSINRGISLRHDKHKDKAVGNLLEILEPVKEAE